MKHDRMLFMKPMLTKSRFLAGRQCKKLLWYRVFSKDSFPTVDLSQEAIFDQGDEVGELARTCFPGGILVTQETTAKNLAETAELLPKRVPLFEAGFQFSISADGSGRFFTSGIHGRRQLFGLL